MSPQRGRLNSIRAPKRPVDVDGEIDLFEYFPHHSCTGAWGHRPADYDNTLILLALPRGIEPLFQP